MKLNIFLLVLATVPFSQCSIGDQLPEFQGCLHECIKFMGCTNVFAEIDKARGNTKRYDSLTFHEQYQISPVFRPFWNCHADCNYKCQQLVTNQRASSKLPMVQFYGKWPFTRVLGMQEIFSVLFSVGNFSINYTNLFKVLRQYQKNKKSGGTVYLMYMEYLQLIVVSLIGWIFSTLFHMRDNAITETLDYYGAFAIILSAFSAITVRYFELFKSPWKLRLWKIIMFITFAGHCLKLKMNWDYHYNTMINLFLGVSSILMWVLHSLSVRRRYLGNFIVYNNSMTLLPFEIKILNKLNYLSISKPKLIPLLPILLNLWMVLGMSFEIFDFEPFGRLLDAHAIWHLFTIFPTIVWYDWNIWDLELMKINDEKLS